MAEDEPVRRRRPRITAASAAAKKAPAKKAPAKKVAPRAAKKVAPPDPKKEAVKKIAQEAAEAAARDLAAQEGATEAELTDEELAAAVEQVFAGIVMEPVYLAFKMKVAGATYEEIVSRTSFEDVVSCQRAVEAYTTRLVAQRSAEQRQHALLMSEQTYESIKFAHWDRATLVGDVQSAMVVLRAQAQLDKIQRNGEVDATAEGGRTIVVAGSPEEYEAKLRRIYNEQHQIEGPDGTVDAEVVDE
jgi:hypothetical protein